LGWWAAPAEVALTNGQVVIGVTGATPVASTPSGDANEIAVTTGAGSIAIGIADDAILPGTSANILASGTDGQRPAAGTAGRIRYNTSSNVYEYDNGATWNTFSVGLGSPVAVADGGTGATTALGATQNLGVEVGVDVQAYDAGLQSISGLVTAADEMIYTTALDTYSTTSLTAFARTLLFRHMMRHCKAYRHLALLLINMPIPLGLILGQKVISQHLQELF
jgi:hypothetical protein